MRKLMLAGLLATAALALLAAPAGAKGRTVMKSGSCSGASTWKLKAKLDDGRIETEFEVDQNRVGRQWRVVLRRNGAVSLRVLRTTTAPSGSFEVRRLMRNGAGPDRISARARALATGEVCSGALTF